MECRREVYGRYRETFAAGYAVGKYAWEIPATWH